MPCSSRGEDEAYRKAHVAERVRRGLSAEADLPWEVAYKGKTVAAFAEEYEALRWQVLYPGATVARCPSWDEVMKSIARTVR